MTVDHIANVSDLHVNSVMALCTPHIKLDDGGEYQASPGQLVIWQAWLDYWQKFKALKGTKYIIINGDCGDLATDQTISPNPSDVLQLTQKVLEPALACKPKYIFILRGTEYHTGRTAWLEECLAAELGAIPCADTGANSWWRLRLNIQDVQLDFAHHCNIGALPWTEANPLVRMLYEIETYNQRNALPVPHLVSRAHVHQSVDTYSLHPNMRAFTTPSWQSKTAYGHKRATNKATQFGGTFITIVNGAYTLRHIVYQPRKETVWTPLLTTPILPTSN